MTSGRIEQNGTKVLVAEKQGEIREFKFDFVINAMYANYNRFCDWFGFKRRLFQFNLQELNVIELPTKMRLGVTIQDGPFPSFLPFGNSNKYLLAHVESSQLIRDVSSGTTPLLNRVNYVQSNWQQIRDTCSDYIPLLQKATYLYSLFVDRVVDVTRLEEDARMTDITNHGCGCWSIFAAKIITSEAIAQEVAMQIRREI